MERDFMGLNARESVVVKEEICDEGKDSGFAKGSGKQWPYLNKVSALPHFMRSTHEEKQKKIVADPVTSSGFMPMTTADAFDSSQKSSTVEIQHDVHRSHDVKTSQFSKISVAMSNPFFKTHFPATCQNLAGSIVKQQMIGGFPTSATQSLLPSAASIAGLTEPWNTNSSGTPAQLTIFYAGTVNVYNDITPEKAQAIMLLAGNGFSMACNVAHLKPQVQAPTSKLAASDCGHVNQPTNTHPSSGLSSPISVSSHNGTQSASGSTDELRAAKTTALSITPGSNMDPPKVVHSMGSVNAPTMIPCVVPQFRQKSLARFLEKRKERVMNSAPYNQRKKFPECATPEA